MSVKKCPTPATSQKKPSVDLSKTSNIRKLIKESQAMRRKLRQQHSDEFAALAQEQLLKEKEAFEEWASAVEDAIKLDPTEGIKVEDQLAAMFNQRGNLLDTSVEYNTPGNIRSNLSSARRAATNMIDLAAKAVSMKRIKAFREAFNETFKSYGVPKSRYDKLRVQIHEIGQQWDNEPILGRTPTQEWFMKYREDKLIEELTGYGMQQSEISDLVNLSREITATFDEVNTIASMLGVKGDKVQNIGYFRRALTEKYGMLFEAKTSPSNRSLRTPKYQQIGVSYTNTARNSWHFLPEDFDALTTLPGFDGLKADDLQDMWLNDPLKFRNYLHEKVPMETLETLADTGVLSKIPMTSSELSDYLNEVFPLPLKEVNEKFKTDPVEALNDYAQNLKKAAADASLLKYISSFGVQKGWAIPKAVVDADPKKYQDFIRMDRASFDRFGIGEVHELMGKDVTDKLGAIYVHPRVMHQTVSLMKLTSSPEQMGNLGQFVTWLSKHLNVSILASSGVEYVNRLTVGTVLNGISAGMDIKRLLPGFWEFTRIHQTGLGFAKGKRTYIIGGQEVDSQEVARQFFMRQGQDVVPQVGADSDIPNLRNLNPLLLPRAIKDIIEYSGTFGDPLTGTLKGTAYTAKLVDRAVKGAFHPLASVANYLELGVKYVTWMSMFKVKGFEMPVGKVGWFKHADSFDEASRMIDEYFVNYSAMGEVPDALKHHIPFSGYLLQNPPSQLRDLLRRPVSYVNYLRLLNRMGGQTACGKNLQSAGFTEAELDSFPVVLSCDPNTKAVTTLFPANYDPRVDAFLFTYKGAKTLHRLFGQPTGNPQTDLKIATGESNLVQEVVNEMANLGNIPFKTIVEGATGKSLFNGAPIFEDDDFRGYKMNPLMRYIVTRYPIIGAIEGDRGIGRLFSPLFPEKTIKDEFGRVIREGDVLTEMSPSEKKKFMAENTQGYVARLASIAGANIRTIDLDEGSQFSLESLYAAHRQLETQWSDKVKELAEMRTTGKGDIDKQVKELEEMALILDSTELDIMRLKAYLRENNIPERRQVSEIKSLMLQQGVRELPMPLESDAIMQRMAEERFKKIQKVINNDNK